MASPLFHGLGKVWICLYTLPSHPMISCFPQLRVQVLFISENLVSYKKGEPHFFSMFVLKYLHTQDETGGTPKYRLFSFTMGWLMRVLLAGTFSPPFVLLPTTMQAISATESLISQFSPAHIAILFLISQLIQLTFEGTVMFTKSQSVSTHFCRK